jgi:hypothetical protein
MSGDKSAAGLPKIECFSKKRTGVIIGSINKDKRFLNFSPPLNQEDTIYNRSIICNTTKNI